MLDYRLTFTNPDEETIIINGPGNDDRHHRSAVISFRGNPCIAQRFAVDWMQLGPDGMLFSGSGTENTTTDS